MGYPATQTWTAAVDQPWLTVTPTSGNASQPVNVAATLEQAQIDALDSGMYTANISVKPANGLALTIPVTLNITRVQVNFAAPHVAISNTTDTVVIRGENFSQITPTAVNFGTTAATSFSIVGNTEIIATYPKLAAGSYTVHVVNTQGIDRTTATLVVVDPTAFTAGTIPYPYPGTPQYLGGFLYDAERSALIANIYNAGFSTTRSTITRYGYVSGSWGQATQADTPYPSSIALSVDGKQLLQAFEDPAETALAVARLDPAAIQTRTSILDTRYDADATSMAIASDGEAVIISGSTTATGLFPIFGYSQLKSTLSQLTMPTPPAKAVVGASADGSAVLIVSNANASGPQILRYDPITQATSLALTSTVPTPAGQASTISLNRHGTLALLNSTQVLDSSLSAVGSLPTTTIGAVLAPTAMRAYTYDQNGTVRIWDVSATPVVEVTPAITLTGTPVSTQAVLTVTPDGGTLFLALDSGIVITPTPLVAP
jgi:hypothetical protein